MKKELLIGIGAVVVLIGGYFVYDTFLSKRAKVRKQQKKELGGTEEEAETEPTKRPPVSKWKRVSFPMGRGMKGEEAKDLQKYLNRTCRKKLKKLYPLQQDGKFGKKTEAALIVCKGVSELSKSAHSALLPYIFKR